MNEFSRIDLKIKRNSFNNYLIDWDDKGFYQGCIVAKLIFVNA